MADPKKFSFVVGGYVKFLKKLKGRFKYLKDYFKIFKIWGKESVLGFAAAYNK